MGRDAELDELMAVAADSSRGGVIVVGDPGMGKSRLVAEALELQSGAGEPTVHVLASEAASDIPLGAFSPHLPPSEWTLGGAMPMLIVARESLRRRCGGRRLVRLPM